MKKFAGFTDEVSHDLSAQISALKELQWCGIETRMVTVDGKSVHFDDIGDDDFLRMKEMLEKEGIQIVSYGTQIANWARKITGDFALDVSELKRIIPRMHATGTKLARIMSYPNDGLSDRAYRTEVIRRLKELAKIAEDGGVILAHENCSGYGGDGAIQSLDMLAGVNSDALKLIFDMGNCVVHGQNAIDFYSAVKYHIVHIHIKDYCADSTQKEGYRATFPGEGLGAVIDIVKMAKEDGYNGWFTMEPHMASVAHEGKHADGSDKSRETFIKYGRIFESIF